MNTRQNLKGSTMKKNLVRAIGGAALIASVLLGSTACGQGAASSEAAPAATVSPDKATPAEVSGAIKSFFATATSDEIGAAFPDKATDKTFAPVLAKIDLAAPAAPLKKAVTDLALLKVSDPKAALAVTVDDSQVVVDGLTASVPASAVSVTSAGVKVPNSDVLASEVNHLVFRDGAWQISFLDAPTASASASATPSASASK